MQCRLAASQKDPKHICLTTTTTRKTNIEYNPHQYTSTLYTTLNIIENTEKEISNTKTKSFTNICTKRDKLHSYATNINHSEFICKTAANNSIKINTHSVEAYRKLVQHFKQNNVEFHTYQLEQEEAYRNVTKNLHPTIPTTLIRQ